MAHRPHPQLPGRIPGRVDQHIVQLVGLKTHHLAHGVDEKFPVLEGYELKEENLLDYEQLKAVFRREKFQASLLFNTGPSPTSPPP